MEDTRDQFAMLRSAVCDGLHRVEVFDAIMPRDIAHAVGDLKKRSLGQVPQHR